MKRSHTMNRLKELRKEKKLTQEKLAQEIGVSKITILRWENGERQIKPDKIQQLADFFNVPVGYLLGYDNELQNKILSATSELEEATKKAFDLANSNLEIKLKGFDETISLLIEGIKEEKLPKETILEALEGIKEFAQSIDETVNLMIKYQAEYTAEQLLRYKLEKSVNKEN